ncbi:hypothetical protein HPP92_013954 [Vanilla planifolia]|uniref:CCR4-NOT transcription complex subunit 3 n=1 Tax=Vanilla planifolia TaxID=51239 RepID=A0A835UX59_VANPL|nr:hypothetical protein HPP92_013954 [Vanilla planifolia]
MERFKVCEKETKTKAFSKEGLGQQPKTDPKEKAKAETRDWLNNVVADLENEIDNFEAEVEGLSVKKGKARPPRLVHLETSIVRHKAHIMKLELILRLVDNDELSPDQVNDVKDLIEDYVERNQESFDEFSDVDELYSSLPLDKVEVLEELVSHGPSSLVKSVGSIPAAIKNSIANSSTAHSSQLNGGQDQNEETASLDSNPDTAVRTAPSTAEAIGSSATAPMPIVSLRASAGSNLASSTSNVSVRSAASVPTASSILSSPIRGTIDGSSPTVPTAMINSSTSMKEDGIISFSGRRSPAIPDMALGGVNRGSSNLTSITTPLSFSSVSSISSSVPLSSAPAASGMNRRNILSVDERIPTGGLAQTLVSPLTNKVLLPQVSESDDVIFPIDSSNSGESPVTGGRVFSPSIVSGGQWRPQSATSFQNQNETGQLRGRPEIASDPRKKYLQRLEQQGHGTLLNTPPRYWGKSEAISNSTTESSVTAVMIETTLIIVSQAGIRLNAPAAGLASAASVQQVQAPVHKQSPQHPLISSGARESDIGNSKIDELQQQTLLDDLNVGPNTSSDIHKAVKDDDLKSPYMISSSSSVGEGIKLSGDTDLTPGQPLQTNQASASVGVIGRRSVSDLGAIGDNLSVLGGNAGGMHDQNYNLQMLESAFYKLPQPKDSERIKNYVPRQPAVTPGYYPQTPAEIVENPAFWERVSMDSLGTDTLFFSFYYQQNTYQQYLAARELKRQSWRFHRKYNTWFQRHVEPKVTTDEYERGTYVYFDFHIADDSQQQGWCQRIKNDFTFEYNYLEDELVM